MSQLTRCPDPPTASVFCGNEIAGLLTAFVVNNHVDYEAMVESTSSDALVKFDGRTHNKRARKESLTILTGTQAEVDWHLDNCEWVAKNALKNPL